MGHIVENGLTQTSKSVYTVNVHGTTAANTFSARATECECRIHFVLDLDQCIQHHWASLVQINLVCLHKWLRGRLVWVPSVNLDRLHLGILCDLLLLDCFRLRGRYGRASSSGGTGGMKRLIDSGHEAS